MKTKSIIIIAVIIIALYVVYTKYGKSTPTITSITSKSATIPASVEKHLRDFSEGEKMSFEGKEYQVSNGAWVSI